MPATSKEQANLMRMALAVKTKKKKLSDMPKGARDKIKKIVADMTENQIRDFTKLQEDASGPPGGATLDSTIGRGSYDFGNNPQNGNSDQRRGSGEASGGTKRDLTKEEKAMLDMAHELENGSTKIMNYGDFRAKSIRENFVSVASIKEAIDTHLGDFGVEAHNIVAKLPTISGQLEIKNINEALAGTYKVGQIQKIINAVSNKRDRRGK